MAKEKKEKKANYCIIKGVKWTADKVKLSIATNDKAVVQALMKLYSLQTEYEKAVKETSETNRVGFNAFDAEILTSFSQQYEKKQWLSPKQLQLARKKLLKYSRQLFDIIHKSQKETYEAFGL